MHSQNFNLPARNRFRFGDSTPFVDNGVNLSFSCIKGTSSVFGVLVRGWSLSNEKIYDFESRNDYYNINHLYKTK